nr:sugar isomerase [Actinoplanes sp. TBRC 11911]
MAKAYANLRERTGQGETDAFQASEFPYDRRYDRVIAITRSGTTTEIVDLVRALTTEASGTGAATGTRDTGSTGTRDTSGTGTRDTGGTGTRDTTGARGTAATPVTVITSDATQPAADLATDSIALDFADERSVVQTRFATSALALLRAHLGADIESLAMDAEVAVRLPLPVHPGQTEQITFLGRGWTVGIAEEAALKCREAANYWAEAYPAMDYRHGPISIAGPHRVVWAFGDIPPGLADDVEATGASFVHSRHHGGYAALGRWGGGRAPLDPMADLIVAQRVAVQLATARGLDPDQPRNLTRSVLLA